jgi:hypothetical protein
MKKQLTYSQALAKDRDKYLRERNYLARLLRDLIDRIGDKGQEQAISKARVELHRIYGD